MSFFTTDKNIEDESAGILYILIIEIEDKTVYKIGVTKRNIQDRVSEILISFWHQYRYFPYCKPKRFTRTTEVYKKEAMMHKYFADKKYCSEHIFGGCSELFSDIDLEHMLDIYTKCLDGEDICSLK